MYLDTRDLVDRREEIEADLEDEALEEGDRVELQQELKEINEIEDEVVDFIYGEVMIPEDEFTRYAEELASDIGAIPHDSDGWDWPLRYIDWDAAAEALKADYVEVEYLDVNYLVRSV